MKHLINFWLGPLALALTLAGVCCGCITLDRADTGTSAGGLDPTAPGIDFKKTSVGLRGRTLDFVSSRPTALAGARQGDEVYFGLEREQATRLYSRDLASGERSFVAELKELVPGSLIVSPDGRYLVYCRKRELKKYIDDPYYNFPEQVALVSRLDTETGEAEELFDFRPLEWRRYRSDQHVPFVSPDGATVVVLAYDVDRLELASQLSQWLAIEADYRERRDELTEDERNQTTAHLRQLITAHRMAPYLDQVGLAPQPEGEVTEAEREAMQALYQEYSDPQAALLTWHDGEQRALPLKFTEERKYAYHRILVVGNDTVLLVAPLTNVDPTLPQPVLRVDLETGVLDQCAAYSGAPSLIELDPTEQSLFMVYNPVDAEQREVLTETRVATVPLDGSDPTEMVLAGDYLGFVNVTSDFKMLAGQDQDTQDLYIIDTASGERTLVRKLLSAIESLFLADEGPTMVYSDNGVLFQLDVSPESLADPDWVDDSHLDQHLEKVLAFFERAGYTVPQDIEYDWEERQGLGAHEFAFELRNPAVPGTAAILRYLADKEQVASVWFPRGQPFAIDSEMQGEDLDYYQVEDLAKTMLDRLGWLDPSTRTIYQPGDSPIYDGKTDSFVVTFRDGYWLGEGDDARWVYSKEATLRLHASDGSIAEMTLSELDPVTRQPISISLDTAVFHIRNYERMPIPEDAPATFDTENYRLVVHQVRMDNWTDAGYELALINRLCYEIDGFIQPENRLFVTTLVDTETGRVHGQISYQ